MNTTVTLTGEEAAVLGVGLMVLLLFVLVFWILCIIARWKIFTKAGERGWKSIIPIYADYVQWRIGWNKTGLFWLMLVLVIAGTIMGYADGTFVVGSGHTIAYSGSSGVLGSIGSILILAGGILELVSVYKLFKSFGHGIGWLIGFIFVPNIMLLVLGFGSSWYYGQQD